MFRRRSKIVRIQLWPAGKLYAYRCDRRTRTGDVVVVDTPYSGVLERHVMYLGRGGYFGPLQPAILVERRPTLRELKELSMKGILIDV